MGSSSSSPAPWDPDTIPEMAGKTIIITGANSGLGLEATTRLAQKGAHIVMACRNKAKAEKAIDELSKKGIPTADLEFMECDLASFASVKKFADEFKQRHSKLHLLINNAAIMATPFERTVDGNECQFQANHFSHFLLTGLLIDRLKESAPSRIVNHSSMAHDMAKKISVDTWNDESAYETWKQYGETKLANLLFSLALKTRLATSAPGVTVASCHPGWTATNLQFTAGKNEIVFGLLNNMMAQDVSVGAQPLLYAATGSDIEPGDFTGPSGFKGFAGPAIKVQPSVQATDTAAADELWALSVKVTGLDYLS